jgi:hypothetical protein
MARPAESSATDASNTPAVAEAGSAA